MSFYRNSRGGLFVPGIRRPLRPWRRLPVEACRAGAHNAAQNNAIGMGSPLMPRAFGFAAALAIVVLAGCFTSAGPLILPGDADYPWHAGTRFAAYRWNLAEHPSKPWAANGGVQTLILADGYYYLSQKDRNAKNGQLLVKRIDDKLFIAQVKSDGAFTYGLLALDGKAVVAYDFAGLESSCPGGSVSNGDCVVPSFEVLKDLFLSNLKSKPQPSSMYVMQ
ncbi:MAG: hypothetical protein ACHQF3_16685 [Alphaproteobacteria bacterium]